eukprot:snap_masked-scaffold_1-processed-gene-21.45-mRNA-1 protein AED:1.00 eAED:1.00 QI:0/-1/0/0/-1/1/1/0/94
MPADERTNQTLEDVLRDTLAEKTYIQCLSKRVDYLIRDLTLSASGNNDTSNAERERNLEKSLDYLVENISAISERVNFYHEAARELVTRERNLQ